MKVKILFFFSVLFIVVGFCFSSCKKYAEGPSISFRKPENRISGTWQLSFTKLNGAICDPSYIQWLRPPLDTSLFVFMGVNPDSARIIAGTALFEKDGDGRFDFIISMGTGAIIQTAFFSWSFDATKRNIIMNYRKQNMTIEVVRLSNKDMNLIYRETGNGTIITSDVEFIKYIPEKE